MELDVGFQGKNIGIADTNLHSAANVNVCCGYSNFV